MKNSIRKILPFLLLTLLTLASTAQIKTQNHIKAIDSLFATYNFKSNQPGISILIIQNNNIIYEKQHGMANIEEKIKIDSTSVFNIGSITKQFTAFCIYLLEEEGRINLNDSLQKYIPELPNFGKTITIKHLLSHTSGILNHLEYLINTGKYQKKYSTAEGILTFYKKYPYLSSIPGERFVYSNSGYMLLQIIIERISGLSITEFTKKNIFEPLNMNSAQFIFDEKFALGNKMLSYSFKKNKFKAEKKPSPSALGATGIFCSLRDLSKWDANFYHNILGNKTQSIIKKMTTTFHFNNGEPVNYGGGLLLKTYNGIPIEEHSGGWNNFLAQHIRFPNEKLSIIITTNTEEISPFQIADELSNILIISKNNPSLTYISKKKDQIGFHLTGKYMDYNNKIIEIKYMHDTLCLSNYQDTIHYKVFFTKLIKTKDSIIMEDNKGELLRFYADQCRNIQGFHWSGSQYFSFKRDYKFISYRDELDSTLGIYNSELLDLKLQLIRKNSGQFILKKNFIAKFKLDKIAPNIFKLKNSEIYLKFEKGKLIISEEWMGNIELIKHNN